MGNVLMSIGGILFYRAYPGLETPSFETVTREMSATLPAQGRLGRDDAIQFTGPGEELISVHGRLFPYQFGGLDTMDQLRTALRAGQPMMVTQFSPNMTLDASLTSGATYSSTVVGNYMIRSLKKTNSLFTSDGIPMKVDFTLEVVLYGDDLTNGVSTTPTTTTTTPTTTTPTPPAATTTSTGTFYNLLS